MGFMQKNEIVILYIKCSLKGYLLQASIVILKHKATRNTALTSAPSTSALAQPNVFFDHFFGDIWNENSIYSLNIIHT